MDQDSVKISATIYQHGIKLVDDFYGDFELTIDSLGGTYFFEALGYYTKGVILDADHFQFITLETNKNKQGKLSRQTKRKKRHLKREKRKYLKGRKPIAGGCCFVSGTKILMADRSEENIENIKLSDQIITYDFDSAKFKVSEVINVDTVVHDDIIEIEFEKNIRLSNTDDHPYYVFSKGICSYNPEKTQNNYGIKAGQLETGDLCFSYFAGQLITIQIKNISIVNGRFITYNITEIDNNNNYIVNGIIVNNESE